MSILHLAVETAATQTKPAQAGYKTLDFRLVRAGGLALYSPEFYSEGLVQDSHEFRAQQRMKILLPHSPLPTPHSPF